MFRKDEFRTPSPQLASWHQPQALYSTATEDNPSDDFYFHSSENAGSWLQLSDIKSVNYSSDIVSVNSNQVILPEPLDSNRYLRCITPELTNGCSRSVIAGETVYRPSYAGSQFSESQRLIVDSRSAGMNRSGNKTLALSGGNFRISSSCRTKSDRLKKRPPYSYMQLIRMAISSSAQHRMTLREIYQFIESQFPYYRQGNRQGWKNSIRHNLSLYDMFVRVKSVCGDRASGSYWTLSAENTMTTRKTSCNNSTIQSESECDGSYLMNHSESAAETAVAAAPAHSDLHAFTSAPLSSTSRKGRPVPLLPKPTASSQLQTFTIVPVQQGSHNYTSLHVVAAEPMETNFGMSQHVSDVASTRNNGRRLLPKTSTRTTRQLQAEGSLNFTVVNHLSDRREMPRFPPISAADERTLSKSMQTASHPIAVDSSLMSSSLDTSVVRRQLSDLQFDSVSRQKINTQRQAKSASEIILLRNFSVDAANLQCATLKPKAQKLRRRKQEFNQLLQTPPYDRQNVGSRKPTMERQKSEADSGFGSYCELTNSAIESELKLLAEDALTCSQTPPHQIRAQSSIDEVAEPLDGDCDAEEDMNMMLFTPFKIVAGSSELPELSPDIELSASIVAGSEPWASFTPISAGAARARTSTPCRLLGTLSEDGSKQPSDFGTSLRLSQLLSEFTDDDEAGTCSFDAMTSSENMSMGDPTTLSGPINLDEVFELDVFTSFGELQ